MALVPAAAVVAFGVAAITLCLRQRDPRVPFIAVIGLIILIAISAGAMLVAFNPRP
jgi:CHASE2 domain-containing sensor protein